MIFLADEEKLKLRKPLELFDPSIGIHPLCTLNTS